MLIQEELNGNSVIAKKYQILKGAEIGIKTATNPSSVYKLRTWTLKPANKPTGYQPRGLQTSLCLKQDILSPHVTRSIVFFERLNVFYKP